MGGEQSDSSPLMAPAPIAGPSEIDLEGGPDEQIQCRICLETDGRNFIAPCKCKGTAKYVHRECLDHWSAVKEGFVFSHCTTCKAPYYIRVHGVADRNWGTLKFRFFVTRYILFVFSLCNWLLLCWDIWCILLIVIRNSGFVTSGVSTMN